MPNDYRYKLMKTFWYTVKQTGMTDDEARAFVWSKYQKRISMLTEDELYERTAELAKIHQLGIGIPKRPQKQQKKKAWNQKHVDIDDRIELASPGQLDKIDIMSQAIGLTDDAVLNLLKKMGWTPGTPVTLVAAQRAIEAMKAMNCRKWKPNNMEKNAPENDVVWN